MKVAEETMAVGEGCVAGAVKRVQPKQEGLSLGREPGAGKRGLTAVIAGYSCRPARPGKAASLRDPLVCCCSG